MVLGCRELERAPAPPSSRRHTLVADPLWYGNVHDASSCARGVCNLHADNKKTHLIMNEHHASEYARIVGFFPFPVPERAIFNHSLYRKLHLQQHTFLTTEILKKSFSGFRNLESLIRKRNFDILRSSIGKSSYCHFFLSRFCLSKENLKCEMYITFKISL